MTGEVQEPWYRRKQQNARLVERATRHGVLPAELENLEMMPSNVGFLRAEQAAEGDLLPADHDHAGVGGAALHPHGPCDLICPR